MKVKTGGRRASRRPRHVSARGPRRAAWRKSAAAAPAVKPTLEQLDAERLARRAEELRENEDDFADGRSSGGLTMRDEEDAWGRGLTPGERPFPEDTE